MPQHPKADPVHQLLVRGVFATSMDTILKREAVYGSGSDSLGRALAALFPEGVTLETTDDFARFSDFQQVVAKLNRYARSFAEGGHADSIHDAGNYAKLLEVKDLSIKGGEPDDA